MSLDFKTLKLEVLSSVLGETLQLYDKRKYGTRADILSVDDFLLDTVIGKKADHVRERFINAGDFFDPQYDYDFTNLTDSTSCTRGDEPYTRPKGWYRIALKVKGKYPDGDTWLGKNEWRSHSVPGEWPVSYHGTSLDGADGIIKSHYSAGPRQLYGRGIYSTPDISVAEQEIYAKTFKSKTTGKRYKVILQNRINPKKREICKRKDYWLVRINEGTSAAEEEQIVRSSIRPYGILFKEVDDDNDGNNTINTGEEQIGGAQGGNNDGLIGGIVNALWRLFV